MAPSVQKEKSKPQTKGLCGAARLQASSRMTVCTLLLLLSVRFCISLTAKSTPVRRWRHAKTEP